MFKSEMSVYRKDFIDIKQHILKFNTYINNNKHIMIKAPIRYRETSLIIHLFKINKYDKTYIDIKRAISLQSLAQQIINEVELFLYAINVIENIAKK